MPSFRRHSGLRTASFPDNEPADYGPTRGWVSFRYRTIGTLIRAQNNRAAITMPDDWMTQYTTSIEKERAWKAHLAVRMVRFVQIQVKAAAQARLWDQRRLAAEHDGRASAFADVALDLIQDLTPEAF